MKSYYARDNGEAWIKILGPFRDIVGIMAMGRNILLALFLMNIARVTSPCFIDPGIEPRTLPSRNKWVIIWLCG